MEQVKGFFLGLLKSDNRDRKSSELRTTAKDDFAETLGISNNEKIIMENAIVKDSLVVDEKKSDNKILEMDNQNVSVISDDLFDEIIQAVQEPQMKQQEKFDLIEAIQEESVKHVAETVKPQESEFNRPELQFFERQPESFFPVNETNNLSLEFDKIGHDINNPGNNKNSTARDIFISTNNEEMVTKPDLISTSIDSETSSLKLIPKKRLFTPYDPVQKTTKSLPNIQTQTTNILKLKDAENELLVNTAVEPSNSSSDEPPRKKRAYVKKTLKEHKRSIFTPEEDELIKEYVRRNPHLKNTHSLYHQIAIVLNAHTGNSIRSRFFGTLFKALDYVYEIDKTTGEVLKDDDGNFIKTSILPGGIKRFYTAEEDYIIALSAKCLFYLNVNRDLEDNKIDPYNYEHLSKIESAYYTAVLNNDEKYIESDPEKLCCNNDGELQPGEIPNFARFRCNKTKGPTTRVFFNQMGTSFPQHTALSWRDRYDKFMKKYGIDNYIRYYNRCLLLNVVPLPIKELSSVKNKALMTLEKDPSAGTLEDLELKFKRKNNYSGNYNREHTEKP
ncbi:hypothetical protein QEN19_004262 [Hanseniaspora menglaensis]